MKGRLWLKFGIIFDGILFVLFLLDSGIYSFPFSFASGIGYVFLPVSLLLNKSFEEIHPIALLVLALILYFLLGAIIGFIIQKVKYQRRFI